MPERYAAIANDSFGNRILPLPFEAPSLDLYTYWHQDVEQDPASRWLRRQVKEAFSTRLGPP